MREMRNAGHLYFNRYSDLALNLLRAAARPLGDDLNVVVGHVGICLDGQIAERDDAPGGEHNDAPKDKPAIGKREVDECANHLLVPRSFKQQSVRYDLLARRDARKNLLPVAGEHLTGTDLNAPELIAASRYIHPVAIVQVKNGIRWDHCEMRF